MPNLTKSPKEIKDKIKEQEALFFIPSQNIQIAKDLRSTPRPELDGKTLEVAYVENERFSHSFNSPKQNKDEVKAVTGVAEKKTDVLYSELLSSNFQPTIKPYDTNNMEIRGLGNDLKAMVHMTNRIEDDDRFWTLYGKEILTQMGVFIEEEDVYEELNQTSKLKLNLKGGNIVKMKNGKQAVHYCRKRMLTALQVYLGDTSIPFLFFQDQPFIFKYALISFGEFKRFFGAYPNADYVSPSGYSSELYPANYKIRESPNNMVEMVFYYNPGDNEYAIRANGFYLHNEKLPMPHVILPDRRYNIEMNAGKIISPTFAYGRAPISSAKTLQAVNTEFLRLMIRKFRQSVEPPLLNYSNQVFGADVWLPSAITKIGSDGDLKPLNANAAQGITQGEYNMYDLIEKKIGEFVGAGDIQQGVDPQKGQTATQVISQQKNFLKNMAITFNAWNRAKKQATKLRILNLFENHTDAIDKKVIENNGVKEVKNIYERFSASNLELPDKRRGTLVTSFTDRAITPEETAAFEEIEDKEEDRGVITRFRFINKNLLFNVMQKFDIIIENKPAEGSEIEKALYDVKLNGAATLQKLAGSRLNRNEWEDEFETLWNSKNLFVQEQSMQSSPMQSSPMEAGGETQIGDQLMESTETGMPNKPSLNALEDNV